MPVSPMPANHYSEEFLHFRVADADNIRRLQEILLIEYANKQSDTQDILKSLVLASLFQITRQYFSIHAELPPERLSEHILPYMGEHIDKAIRFHDLRHSCASILYANGIDLMTIQEVLGHAQLTTTIMYTHKLSDRKTAALTQMSDQFLAPKENRKEESEN